MPSSSGVRVSTIMCAFSQVSPCIVWDKRVARYSVIIKAYKGYAERLPVALRSERSMSRSGLSPLLLCLSKLRTMRRGLGVFYINILISDLKNPHFSFRDEHRKRILGFFYYNRYIDLKKHPKSSLSCNR